MKLICDICQGDLQMLPGGQSAACVNCGVTYPIERLREKMQSVSQPAPQAYPYNAAPQAYQPQYPSTRNLIITRKVDLMLCKAAVIIDGQTVVPLNGQGKTTVIPIPVGVHTIAIRVADGTGVSDIGQATINIGNFDWEGNFWLHRGAFKASYRFEAKEIIK